MGLCRLVLGREGFSRIDSAAISTACSGGTEGKVHRAWVLERSIRRDAVSVLSVVLDEDETDAAGWICLSCCTSLRVVGPRDACMGVMSPGCRVSAPALCG